MMFYTISGENLVLGQFVSFLIGKIENETFHFSLIHSKSKKLQGLTIKTIEKIAGKFHQNSRLSCEKFWSAHKRISLVGGSWTLAIQNVVHGFSIS